MDRNRVYKVLIDGSKVGELWPGKTGAFDISAGEHRIRVKIDFMGSKELTISPSAGEVIELSCNGHGSALALFNTIFRWNSYLDLRVMTVEESNERSGIAKRQEPPPPRNIATD
jgi:hypothetical protein